MAQQISPYVQLLLSASGISTDASGSNYPTSGVKGTFGVGKDTASVISAAIGIPLTVYAAFMERPMLNTGGIADQQAALASSSAANNEALSTQTMGAISARNSAIAAGQQSGLAARGITDTGVRAATAAQQASNASGARAAAAAALAKAKASAGNAMAESQSRYDIALAEKAFDQQLQAYAARMGVWGALGGAVGQLGQLVNRPSVENQAPDIQADIDDFKKKNEHIYGDEQIGYDFTAPGIQASLAK